MSSNVDHEGAEIYKVYIPYKLLTAPYGYLHGLFSAEKCIVCVTFLTPDGSDKHIKGKVKDKLHCVGYWHGNQEFKEKYKSYERQKSGTGPVWMDINISQQNRPICRLIQLKPSLIHVQNSQITCTCIVYDAAELLSSYLLCDKGRSTIMSSVNLSNMDTLVYFLYQCQRMNGAKILQTSSDYRLIPPKRTYLGYPVILAIATFMGWLYCLFGRALDNRFMNHQYVRGVVSHVAFLHQIELRYLQVKKSRLWVDSEPFREIRRLNVNTRLVLDMGLGVILMVALMGTGTSEYMASYIITWADSVVIWLNNLLDWLMGVPAGLKLNSQLDQFLGRFFHYHIYLWTGYLTLLKPVLAPLLWYSSIVGVLGLTTQLCLLQDIFSTLTVHIYCFYVYAARLYYFQLYGVRSLWRLFRGKKWNVLRRRVDSALYDVDQLFVGTLLFTILLFLLPTTALYYVVFLGLRLLVLCVTGIVSKIVSVLNSLPIHGLLLRLVRSTRITGDIMLTVSPKQPTDNGLLVQMKTIHVSYSHVMKLLGEKNVKGGTQPNYTWGNLIHRVFIGELIYPWVETASQSEKQTR